MQGRLLPKFNNRYQAFPVNNWEEEFFISRDLGLDLIEFIFDKGDINLNPLMSDGGIDNIKRLTETTGVNVKSVCADYFMHNPICKKYLEDEILILKKLIINSSKLGITDIVIPCVDNSSLDNKDKIKNFTKNIQILSDFVEKNKINLAIESDLNPKNFLELVNSFKSDYITINYDTGNSAALGFNSLDEIEILGRKISSFHIKDRIFNGGSVVLGQGDCDFNKFFLSIKKLNITPKYFIMQVYRDDEGIEIFKKQLNWFVEKLEFYFSNNL